MPYVESCRQLRISFSKLSSRPSRHLFLSLPRSLQRRLLRCKQQFKCSSFSSLRHSIQKLNHCIRDRTCLRRRLTHYKVRTFASEHEMYKSFIDVLLVFTASVQHGTSKRERSESNKRQGTDYEHEEGSDWDQCSTANFNVEEEAQQRGRNMSYAAQHQNCPN